MATETPLDDASRCPLCGGDNRCAMELQRATGQAQAPCWCVQASFPPALLATLPAQAQGKACICSDCLRAFVQRSTPLKDTP